MEWRKLPDWELYVLLTSPTSYHVRDVLGAVKDLGVQCGEGRREMYKLFCWVSPKGKDNLEDLSVDGRVIIVFCCVRRIVNVITMD